MGRALVQRPDSWISRLRGEAAVLEGAELGENVAPLEGAPDAKAGQPMRTRMLDRSAAQRDRSGSGRELAGEQIDQRGLAGAVGSDDRMDLPAAELYRNSIDRDEATKPARQPARGEHRLSHGAS